MHGRILLGLVASTILIAGCSQSDSGITTNVKSKLVADEVVRARNINVDTRDHVVTLTGTVQSSTEENRALEIARRTGGVADVIDRMTVASAGEPGAAPTAGIDTSPGSVGSAVGDATITADVKARLLADADVSGLKIDVDTRDRVVTLSGTVASAAQKAHAVELAGRADNAVRVEDNLLVQEPHQTK